MRELHFLLPQGACPFEDRHPRGCHHWAQEEIAWGLRDGPGEMEPPSMMGRMLEGGVRAVGADILEDPMLALEQARSRVQAAERYRRFAETMKNVGPVHHLALDRVYGDPLAETDLLAFGGAANLVPESEIARAAHKRVRTSTHFMGWLAELRISLAGERYRDKRIEGKYHRHPPRASEEEREIAFEIKTATTKKLMMALAAYAMARPRR